MALAAYHSAAFNKQSGLSVAGSAQVEVRKESDGSLAALKQDRAGSLAESNPLTADASGRFSFYVAADSEGFQIKVTDSDGNTLTLNNVAIGLLAEKDTLNILQDADGDTYWEMEESADEDIARLYIAGTQEVRVDATGMVIGGNDVAGDGPLHIGAGLAGSVTANANADEVIVEGSGNTGISILGGASSTKAILFGDSDSNNEFSLSINESKTIEFRNNNVRQSAFTDSIITFNTDSNDIDTQIKGNSNINLFYVNAGTDNIGLGSASPDASALLDLVSTTKGLGLPVWTETERDAISSPRDGLCGYNSTNDSLDLRANSTWHNVLTNLDFDWTNSGAIDLTSGSPTSVSLLSGVSGVNEIEITIKDFSTDSANTAPIIQLGDSGGLETSGYSGSALADGATADSNSSGFLLINNSAQDAGDSSDFSVVLRHLGSNVWALDSNGLRANAKIMALGDKTLSDVLTQITITTEAGTATFDGGTAYVRHR